MKFKKTLLLSLLSVSLMGCTNTGVENPPSSENGKTDTGGDLDNSGGKTDQDTTGKKDDTDSGDNGKKDDKTDDKTDNKDDGTKKDDDGDIYSQTKWPKKIVDEMLKYLGNQIIPYVDLGDDTSLTTDYIGSDYASTRPYLKIEGVKQYDLPFLNDRFNEFKTAGWNCVSTSTGFSATKGTLEAELVADSGFIYVKAYYEEAYDESKETSGAWPEAITSLFDAHLDKHALPYFYLGTVNPYATAWNKEASTGYVYGNGYRDSMVTNAKTALENAGFTVTDGQDDNGKKLTAEIKEADNCTVKVEMGNLSVDHPRIYLLLTFRQGFNDTNYTSWGKDISDQFDSYLDGHQIPAIYLGTDDPDYSWEPDTSALVITGSHWNEDVIGLAKKRLEADVDAEGNCLWTITLGSDRYGNNLSATRVDFSDGCAMSLLLTGTNTYSPYNYCSLTVKFIPKITLPADGTTWSQNVQDCLNKAISTGSSITYMDGHDIPYVYLNTNGESAQVYDSPARYVRIRGGNYNPHVVENAISVYTADNWDTQTLTSSSGYNGFVATKKFAHSHVDETGAIVTDPECEITVKIPAPTTTSPFGDTLFLYVFIKEGFGLYDYTQWDDGIESDMDKYFNGFDLPVLYLGSSKVYHQMGTATNTETIYGGGWDDSLWTSVSSTLKAKGFTVTEPTDKQSSSAVLTATIEDGNSGTVTITLSKYTDRLFVYPLPKLEVHYDWAFSVPENGSWSSQTLAAFKTYFSTDVENNKNIVPYIYLHIANGLESVGSFNTSYQNITITGGTWDGRILTEAETSFTEAGWTTGYDYGSYSKLLTAWVKNEDGSYFRAKVYKDYSGKAKLDVFFDKAMPTTATATDWTEDEKTKMKSVLNGYTIPYFDLSSSMTLQVNQKTTAPMFTSYCRYSYNSSDWTNAYTFNANTVLKANGYDTVMDFNYGYYGPYLSATKKMSDGTLCIELRQGGNTSYYLNVWFEENIVQPENYSYGSEIQSDMTDLLGVTVPSIYLGTQDPYKYTNYAARQVTLSGNGGAGNLIENATELFENDTNNTWTLSYADSNLFTARGKILCAETTNASGEKVCVYVCEWFSNSNMTMTQHYPYLVARIG